MAIHPKASPALLGCQPEAEACRHASNEVGDLPSPKALGRLPASLLGARDAGKIKQEDALQFGIKAQDGTSFQGIWGGGACRLPAARTPRPSSQNTSRSAFLQLNALCERGLLGHFTFNQAVRTQKTMCSVLQNRVPSES